MVIVPKLDRLFRSALDALKVVEDLRARGVKLHLLDLGGDISGNGLSKLFLTIAAAFAKAERDRIRERIGQVKADQKARGRYLGGKVPFGFRLGESRELLPHQAEQEAIREIVALRAQGKALRAIADAVRAECHRISHEGVAGVLRVAEDAPAYRLAGIGLLFRYVRPRRPVIRRRRITQHAVPVPVTPTTDPVSALLVAIRALLRPLRLPSLVHRAQDFLERPPSVATLDHRPRRAVGPIQDHSRCGQLHCRRNRLVIHYRENLVERGGRAFTRKVNQFSLVPREAASVRRSAAREPSSIGVPWRRDNFDRASHVSEVQYLLGLLKRAFRQSLDLQRALCRRATPNQRARRKAPARAIERAPAVSAAELLRLASGVRRREGVAAPLEHRGRRHGAASLNMTHLTHSGIKDVSRARPRAIRVFPLEPSQSAAETAAAALCSKAARAGRAGRTPKAR